MTNHRNNLSVIIRKLQLIEHVDLLTQEQARDVLTWLQVLCNAVVMPSGEDDTDQPTPHLYMRDRRLPYQDGEIEFLGDEQRGITVIRV